MGKAGGHLRDILCRGHILGSGSRASIIIMKIISLSIKSVYCVGGNLVCLVVSSC